MANIKLISPVLKGVQRNSKIVFKNAKPLINKSKPYLGKGYKYFIEILDKNKGKIIAVVFEKGCSLFNKQILGQSNDGKNIFKYDIKELDKYLLKNKINNEIYEYLSNEVLCYNDILIINNKNFEKLFKRIMDSKDIKQEYYKIKQYEMIRNNWIKKVNNYKHSEEVNIVTFNEKIIE